MKLHLVIIDPQLDFCDPKGSLFVPGADEDMKRVAALITRLDGKIDDIHVTMDSHHLFDVAHPLFWKDSKGNHPAPFTIISADDVKNSVWYPSHPALASKAIAYVEGLEVNGRYPLCIWPPHCLIGSWGYGLVPELHQSLLGWEERNIALTDFVTKGSNFMTEHYSAIQADVPDSTDPSTMLNTSFITTLQEADIIMLTGEALSHCVANTVTDVANNFGEDNIKKLVLLEDCSSNVPGFEQFGVDFIAKMTARGMQISNSVDFLS